MKIWEDISNFEAINPVITIGSFDGVHLGHMQVLNQLNSLAKRVSGESVVFTFTPHPAKVLAPQKEFVLLSTGEEKISLFRKAGIAHLILFPFTKEFSQLPYADFVRTILVEKLGINTLLVGYDNSFGKNKEGNFVQLKKLAADLKFEVVKQNELRIGDNEISSTQIRNLLAMGKLLEASKLLGYPYIVSGTVVHGQQLGNKLGFPTANIQPDENKSVPGNGVYAILVTYKGNAFKGMMNIGVRPTIKENTNKPVIEAHLFDFTGNLYGEFISINIVRKLRDEFKFDSVDALRAQLKLDKQFAKETLEKEFGID